MAPLARTDVSQATLLTNAQYKFTQIGLHQHWRGSNIVLITSISV
jgi:hypothetical protein